ncbi:M16 family metallopeptidase [Pseudomonas sp. UFMG81]|uniref:M16 family metallopeptidase n=1 Tax=Pseudomonas sp. UFMG81 TaxID=2745936 RepID=UPI00188F3F30|nr:pitrilysin family protein [Pseudomonas sp. UFMG81]
MTSPSGADARASALLQHFTLDNGLKVYLREDHRAPLACAQLWYHVGASDEPVGLSGLSHMLEHMLFEGSSKLAAGQYSRLISRLGGTANAFTGPDATFFLATLPVSRLEIALEAMADTLSSATLDEALFTRELAVVMSERRLRVDNLAIGLAAERHTALAHGDSGYSIPLIGHHADLERMTTSALRQWHRQWYGPNNASLVVVADMTLERLKAMVEEHFSAIESQQLPERTRPLAPAKLARREQTLVEPGLQDGLMMSFNTPSLATASDPAHAHALRLACHLLTEGNSSRIVRQLVNEEQTLLSTYSKYDHLTRGDTLWSCFAYVAPTVTPQAAGEQLLLQIERLRTTPATEQEISRAKTRLLAGLVFKRDDIELQATTIGEAAASTLDPRLLDQERNDIERITPEQIQQAAQSWLTPERMTLTYLQRKEQTHE